MTIKTEKIIIDGKKYTVCNKNMGSISYVVYQGKIWRWFHKSGILKSRVLGIERPLTNEMVWLKGDEINNIEWYIVGNSYIKI